MEIVDRVEKVTQSLPVKLTQEEIVEAAKSLAKITNEPSPVCLGTGWVGDNGPGLKGNTEVEPCDCGLSKPMPDGVARKVSDLTISELFELIVKAVKECKKQDAEEAEAEYQKLTGGKVPKEW